MSPHAARLFAYQRNVERLARWLEGLRNRNISESLGAGNKEAFSNNKHVK